MNDSKKIHDEIIRANRELHSIDSYVSTYETSHAYMVNSFAQEMFRRDLSHIAHYQRSVFPDTEEPLRALDIGTGTGNLALKLLDLKYRVCAVDISRRMLDELEKKYKARMAEHGDSDSLLEIVDSEVASFLAQTPEKKYHLVTMCSFLHHLPDYGEVLQLCFKHLAPGGMVYIVHEPLSAATAGRFRHFLVKLDIVLFYVRRGLLWKMIREKVSKRRNKVKEKIASLSRMADFHIYKKGIEIEVVKEIAQEAGMVAQPITYALMRNRATTFIARLLGMRDMLSVYITKPHTDFTPPGI